MLIDSGAELNDWDNEGNTIISLAIKNGNVKILWQILKFNQEFKRKKKPQFDLNQECSAKNLTPLYLALE